MVAQICEETVHSERAVVEELEDSAGSSVHVIFQARILEWFAISFHKGSSQPRD